MRQPRGFTIVELMVVVALLSVLLSILLPSLGAARETGRSAVCLTRLRSLVEAQSLYMNSNTDYFAGPRTTGYRGLLNLAGDTDYLFDTTAETPTSTLDWISPTMGESMNLSPNRGRRTCQILNGFACPSARSPNMRCFNDSGMGDQDDFDAVLAEGPVRQISYLSPAPFHYWPGSLPQFRKNKLNQDMGGQAPIGFRTPGDVPANYIPRVDRIGLQASAKVLVSDGTRYLAQSATGAILDFDIDATPRWYGCFTDAGPIYHGSGAFGRGPNQDAASGRHPLSFRHAGESINAAYFDGHVAGMKSSQAWSDATPWYPGGSVFDEPEATPESRAYYNRPGVSKIIP
ncbi:MAG: prepilin-type N-terminal cleavage/methylation domain-containing protein [Phycisphaerales bacterium]|nr:prepilin-type N-terminal cleavage/methylation domain-containing protein [Phycisphaerales bacterium]